MKLNGEGSFTKANLTWTNYIGSWTSHASCSNLSDRLYVGKIRCQCWGIFMTGKWAPRQANSVLLLGNFRRGGNNVEKIQWYSLWISSDRWCNVGNLNLQLGNLSDRWCCVGNSKLWNLQLGNLSDRWCCVGNSKLWYYSLSGARKIVSVSWPLVGNSPISGVPRGATSTPD